MEEEGGEGLERYFLFGSDFNVEFFLFCFCPFCSLLNGEFTWCD